MNRTWLWYMVIHELHSNLSFSLFDLNRSHLDNAQLTQLPTNFLDMKGAFFFMNIENEALQQNV